MEINGSQQALLRKLAIALGGNPERALQRVTELRREQLPTAPQTAADWNEEQFRPAYETVGAEFLEEARRHRSYTLGLMVCRMLSGEEFKPEVINSVAAFCSGGKVKEVV